MNSQADADMISPVQSATIAESCALAVCVTGKVSTVAKLPQPVSVSDESLVDAQADAEAASLVQPPSITVSCA